MRACTAVGVCYGDGVQLTPARVHGGPLACDRCGTFAELSWSWGKRLCEECRERQHPALTTPRSARRLISESVALLPALGWRAVPVALTPLPFTIAVRWRWPHPHSGDKRWDTLHDLGPSTLISMFASVSEAVLVCALLQLLVQGLQRADYPAAWRQMRPRVAAVLVFAAALSLLEDLGAAANWLLGGALAWAPLALALPVLLNEDVGPLTAMRRSALRLRGSYLKLLVSGLVLVLPVLLAVFVLAGIQRFARVPTFDQLGLVLTGCNGLLLLPLTALAAVLYVKLPPRMDVTGQGPSS